MVTVAQSAELWIVAPAVVGSSPIGHPFYCPDLQACLRDRRLHYQSLDSHRPEQLFQDGADALLHGQLDVLECARHQREGFESTLCLNVDAAITMAAA